MSIKFIFSYARSGGTLLSRCLDALPDTVVLSEVHPTYPVNGTIKEQAKKRYHIELLSEGYEANIAELLELCNHKNWQLIIRDWTFIDFTPHEINGFQPSYRFTAYDLLKNTFEIDAVAFVRNPIDIWISRNCPPKFFEVYKKYVRCLVENDIDVIKYEDFCADHKHKMNEICKKLNIPFHSAYLNFYSIQDMSGDNGSHPGSRGSELTAIAEIPRKKIAKPNIRFLENNVHLQACNAPLDYVSDYYEKPIEDSATSKSKLKNWILTLIGANHRDVY